MPLPCGGPTRLEPGGGWVAIILAALAVATPGLQLELPLRVEDGLLLLLFGPVEKKNYKLIICTYCAHPN